MRNPRGDLTSAGDRVGDRCRPAPPVATARPAPLPRPAVTARGPRRQPLCRGRGVARAWRQPTVALRCRAAPRHPPPPVEARPRRSRRSRRHRWLTSPHEVGPRARAARAEMRPRAPRAAAAARRLGGIREIASRLVAAASPRRVGRASLHRQPRQRASPPWWRRARRSGTPRSRGPPSAAAIRCLSLAPSRRTPRRTVRCRPVPRRSCRSWATT